MIIYSALGVYLFFLFWVAVISIIRNRMTKGNLADIKSSVFGTISVSFVQSLHMPVLICDEKGKIVWYNEILLAGYKSHGVLCGKYIDSICTETIEAIVQSGEEGLEVSFLSDSGVMSDKHNVVFCARSYKASSRNRVYYTIIFEDITEVKPT